MGLPLRLALLTALLTGLALGACTNATEPGETAEESITLALSGHLVLPEPVEGSRVTCYDLSPFPDGDPIPLASAETDANGRFLLDLGPLAAGTPLLLQAAEGGRYRNAYLGDMEELPQEPSLAALVVADEELAKHLVVLEPMGTLAASLAMTYRRHGTSLGLNSTGWPEVASLAAERLARHLADQPVPELRFTEPFLAGREEMLWPDPRTLIALADVGLATLACNEFAGATAADLTIALARDLSDGRFDGHDTTRTGDTRILLGEIPLSPATTRYALAHAVYTYLCSHDPVPPAAGEWPVLLGGPGSFFETLSMDTGPLYPEDTPPTLFDPVPPSIQWLPPTPEHQAILCQNEPVTVTAQALDDHQVARFQIVSPTGLETVLPHLGTSAAEATLSWTVTPGARPGATAGFGLEAEDGSGNLATSSRAFHLDTQPPDISDVAPDTAICTIEPPAALAVIVVDDVKVQNVAIRTADREEDALACMAPPSGEYAWTCPLPDVDSADLEVLAQDACQRVSSHTFHYCVDAQPPTLTFDAVEGAWYGPSSPPVEVIVSDNIGPVTVACSANGKPLPVEPEQVDGTTGTVSVSLPSDFTSGTSVQLVGVATDQAGNLFSDQVDLVFDGLAPTLLGPEDPRLLVFATLDDVTVPVTLFDAHSGLETITVTGPAENWTATQDADDPHRWWVQGNPPAETGDAFSLHLEATDAVGNLAQLDLPLALDNTPPLLAQYPSEILSEEQVTATWDPDTSELVYDLEQAPSVIYDSNTCTPGCPPIVRFAPRLLHLQPEDVEKNALPTIRFVVTDDCQGLDDAPLIEPQVQYLHGETLLSEIVLPPVACGNTVFDVLIAWPEFANASGGSPSTNAFAPNKLPDSVLVTVTDGAGNQAALQVAFQMTVRPPPLFWGPVAPEQQPDRLVATLLAPDAPGLDLLATEGGVHERYRLVNPTPVSAAVSVYYPPAEQLQVNAGRVYVEPAFPTGEGCGPGECLYIGHPSAPQACMAPLVFSEQSLLDAQVPTHFRLTQPLPAAQGDEVPTGTLLTVPGEDELWIDLATDWQDLDLAPQPAIAHTFAGGPPVLLHRLPDNLWAAACCQENALPPQTDYFDIPYVVSGLQIVLEPATPLQWTVALPEAPATAEWLPIPAPAAPTQSYAPPVALPYAPYPD